MDLEEKFLHNFEILKIMLDSQFTNTCYKNFMHICVRMVCVGVHVCGG